MSSRNQLCLWSTLVLSFEHFQQNTSFASSPFSFFSLFVNKAFSVHSLGTQRKRETSLTFLARVREHRRVGVNYEKCLTKDYVLLLSSPKTKVIERNSRRQKIQNADAIRIPLSSWPTFRSQLNPPRTTSQRQTQTMHPWWSSIRTLDDAQCQQVSFSPCQEIAIRQDEDPLGSHLARRDAGAALSQAAFFIHGLRTILELVSAILTSGFKCQIQDNDLTLTLLQWGS